MEVVNLIRAIRVLVSEGLVLPYGLLPGEATNNIISQATEDVWGATDWNPPYIETAIPVTADPKASPKPSFADLMAADLRGVLAEEQKTRRGVARVEATNRITAAYGVDDLIDEIWLRLRNESTPEQDAARDAILGKYRALKATIQASTLEEIHTLDVTADEHWI